MARAKEANVSMIRLTHNICTAFSGESFTQTHTDCRWRYWITLLASEVCAVPPVSSRRLSGWFNYGFLPFAVSLRGAMQSVLLTCMTQSYQRSRLAISHLPQRYRLRKMTLIWGADLGGRNVWSEWNSLALPYQLFQIICICKWNINCYRSSKQ